MEAGTEEEEELGAHEWPPDADNDADTNVDANAKDADSKLLFLTVEYVGEPGSTLGFISDLEQRVSPLDPDLSCTACYSPVHYSPASHSPHHHSPNANANHQQDAQVYLSEEGQQQQQHSPNDSSWTTTPTPASTTTSTVACVTSSSNGGYVIATSGGGDSCDVTSSSNVASGYVIARDCDVAEFILPDDPIEEIPAGSANHQAEGLAGLQDGLKVGNGVGQIELLLEDGGVALTVIDQDSDVIQIPRDCLMPSSDAKNTDIAVGADENNFYGSIKSQGLVVETSENGELRIVSFLDTVETQTQLEAIHGGEAHPHPHMTLIIDDASSVPAHSAQPPNSRAAFWCEDCQLSLEAECTLHRVNSIIADKPVPSRARATLPASYLAINRVSQFDSDEIVYSIFARKTIPSRTQFGPIEGVMLKSEDVYVPSPLELLVETETGQMHRLDVSNEDTSNWMRFVRPARSAKEQNLVLSQLGHSLYFTTTRPVHPRQELLVWYSPPYAAKRSLPLLEPPTPPPPPVPAVEKTDWPCFECNQKFKSSEELQKHLNLHENEREARNYDLMKTRSSKRIGQQLALREKSQNIDDPPPPNPTQKKQQQKQSVFECTSCSRTFPRMYSLKRHFRLHVEKRHKCPYCPIEFGHICNRDKHVRKQHSEKCTDLRNYFHSSVNTEKVAQQWACKHCNLSFASAAMLNLHTLKHAADYNDAGAGSKDNNGSVDDISSKHEGGAGAGGRQVPPTTGLPSDFSHIYHDGEFLVENGDIQCPQCAQLFRTKRDLIEHVSKHGQPKEQELEQEQENVSEHFMDENKFGCSYCPKSFDTADRLKQHSLSHVSTAVQCNVCHKRFLNNSALTGHLKTHAMLKSFECPMCKQMFDQMLALKAHVQIHANNGIFTCPHCKKDFDEYSQIRKHIRSFHCDRKFVCEYCQKQFHTQDKLRMHKLKHSDHREFLCANCGKQFKRKDKLQEHMKRMHSQERDQRGAGQAGGQGAAKGGRSSSVRKLVPPKVVVGGGAGGAGAGGDYERFVFKCQLCMLGFKRRGMLVNHLANRHPDVTPASVPELNLPILKTTRDYYCQYCDKIYKSSSKRKAHILKNHPGAALPMSNRQKGGVPEIPGQPNPTFSQTVGSVTMTPHQCQWCHKQYASKAKLLQHQRKKHLLLLPSAQQQPRPGKCMSSSPGGEGDQQQTVQVQQQQQQQQAPVAVAVAAEHKPATAAAANNNMSGNSGRVAVGGRGAGAEMGAAVSMTTSAAIPAINPQHAIVQPLNLQLQQQQQQQQLTLTDTILTEYEIATGDTEFSEGGIVIDAATLKRAIKSDTLPSELLLSELSAYLSQEQCLKLIQVVADESLYSPYTPR